MYLDKTGDTPAENLALDEQLLEECERTGVPVLRTWESSDYFVVLGCSNKVETEVDVAACQQDHIPVFTRCSGGGTVLQGPGCLNFAWIHPLEGNYATISSTTMFIMEKHKQAFSELLEDVDVQGISDLTWKGLKFSGNAQRRKYKAMLFHGTVLYRFDLERIARYLKRPSKQPEYRQNRDHLRFVTNIPLTQDQVKMRLREAWKQ